MRVVYIELGILGHNAQEHTHTQYEWDTMPISRVLESDCVVVCNLRPLSAGITCHEKSSVIPPYPSRE